jgi:hypothetical protein
MSSDENSDRHLTARSTVAPAEPNMTRNGSRGPGKSAIVFALDDKFSPLGKGLVLSLRALGLPDESVDLCLIDIGLRTEHTKLDDATQLRHRAIRRVASQGSASPWGRQLY